MRKRGHLSDEGAQSRQKDRLRAQAQQDDNDLAFIMGTPQGRRFLWRLLSHITGLFGLSFTGNSQTFFNEGRRSVGVDLMREAQRVSPADYVHMVGERLSHAAEDELHRKSAVDSATETDE